MDYRGDIYYIEEVLAGKQSAFTYLVDRHKDHVFNLAVKICGNREEAEEISQDAFIKAFRSLAQFKMKSSFATWLYRIVYNTAVSHVRGRKKGPLLLEDFPAAISDCIGTNSTEDEAEEEYRKALVNFALQKISEEERGIIGLYYYEELSTEEIAMIVGISRSNVKVKLFRARQKMVEIIENVEKENLIYHE
jgi:RNA polymerase sigma-70 factor (ECF subfamily)